MLIIAGTNAGPPRESVAETRMVTIRQNGQREISRGMEEAQTPVLWMMCAGE